ncbi:inhibitor of Bruton tyrosine kinase isoform X2 [Coccinella septempunctata]|uniref:inhibitor of Bruton tyrosine kinase isoform X2 n=1 Tax=Coccinella septempunctata TaxID=41139 RepID=UPI001D06003F|nr:inhibitor of Bruton tyrosine kinase isoform X2 [Coccinella septempunctata]
MSKFYNIHRDCTEYCRSIVHGNLITSAFSVLDISGLQLCSYLNYLCTNCDLIKDSAGRTALHAAASYGYLEVVKWLLNNKNANINARDDESGYTPLHRAFYYGRLYIAIELMKAGADATLLDRDGLTSLDHVIQDGLKPTIYFGSVYTWGINKNNSLGPFSSRNTPECLDVFHKKYPKEYVQQICIDTFHSIIITINGHAYTCGHGLGGRLGLRTENAIVEPTKITFPEKVDVIRVSISRDHSLFLTASRHIYSCGLNTHKVLGLYPPPNKCLSPEKVKCLMSKVPCGVSAGRYHSVAWTARKLYTWGLNGGQLGHESYHGNYIITPRGVPAINNRDNDIKKVVSSDGAIAILTGTGDVYVLHDYMCRKVASRFSNLQNLAIIGGKLRTDTDVDLKGESLKELKVVILTNNGQMFIWRESDPQLCRLTFSVPRVFSVINVSLNFNNILFVTNYGECYTGIIKKRVKKVYWDRKNFGALPVASVAVTKIPKIYRASAIVSDPKGEDFGVIQQHPYATEISDENIMKKEMEYQFTKLLEETTEEDNIHDIVIKINHKTFPAHKYILASESNLMDLCDSKDEIVLKDINVDFFQQLLIFIYTGTCSLLEVGECPELFKKYYISSDGVEQETVKSQKNKSPQNPIRKLQEMSKRFGCKRLHHLLNDFYMQNIYIFRKSDILNTPKCYQITDFPEYYDIKLKCSNGKEIKAHKCILVGRLEYFSNLFAARWSNDARSTISIPHTSDLVEALLEFLYTDSEYFLLDKDGDFLLKLLVLADEYLVEQLKQCCAYLILKLNHLDLKNAIDILQIAHKVKSTFLIKGVMTYVVNNLAYFLEAKALHDLSEELLYDISMYYISYRKLDRRHQTYAISDDRSEKIHEIHNKYPINLEISEKRNLRAMQKMSKQRRSKFLRKSVSEKSLQRDSDDDEKEECTPHCLPNTEEKTENVEKIGQDRVSAICSATRILETSNEEPEFINLKNLSLSDSFDEFPLLNSPPEGSHNRLSSSPSQGKFVKKHKMVRLSQKERLRLSSESKETPQETPKNPWKKIPDISENIAKSPTDSSFSGILLDEKKLKGNLVKITNKQLVHTQMEDKAIMDLEKFYNIHEVEDEVIKVQRVDIGNVAPPVWVPANHAHGSHS